MTHKPTPIIWVCTCCHDYSTSPEDHEKNRFCNNKKYPLIPYIPKSINDKLLEAAKKWEKMIKNTMALATKEDQKSQDYKDLKSELETVEQAIAAAEGEEK